MLRVPSCLLMSHVSPPSTFQRSQLTLCSARPFFVGRHSAQYFKASQLRPSISAAPRFPRPRLAFFVFCWSGLQYHYPAIAPIIKEVCKEHGVEYIHLGTFREAIGAHIAHLRNMGRQVSHLLFDRTRC